MRPGIEKTLQMVDGRVVMVETRTVLLDERSIDALMLVKDVTALALKEGPTVTLCEIARRCEPMPFRWVENLLDDLCDDLGCFVNDMGVITNPAR